MNRKRIVVSLLISTWALGVLGYLAFLAYLLWLGLMAVIAFSD